MNTYRQIKNRLTKEEQAGLNSLLAKVKEQREQAIKAQQELRDDKDAKNVEGVRQEAGTLGLSKGE